VISSVGCCKSDGIPAIILPKSISITMTPKFQIDTPMICLHTLPDRRAWLLPKGGPVRTEARGGSVERAIAANVSIIKLIHKSYTAESGDSLNTITPKRTVAKAEILTVT
jgi:hypothetical protein